MGYQASVTVNGHFEFFSRVDKVRRPHEVSLNQAAYMRTLLLEAVEARECAIAVIPPRPVPRSLKGVPKHERPAYRLYDEQAAAEWDAKYGGKAVQG